MASSGNFNTTRWTVIRTAKEKDELGSAEALAGRFPQPPEVIARDQDPRGAAASTSPAL
jgi:hypothetical protein